MKEALSMAHGLHDADEEDFEYLAHHFAAMRAFYARAAQAGDAIVMHTF